jgi:hypothetical protein
MATVTGLTAERMLAIEAASITQASVVGDNLILKNHYGTTVWTSNVRGPQGLPGDPGPEGTVLGLTAAIDAAEIEWKAYSDLAGKGLVAMSEYSAADVGPKSGIDDSFHTVDNISVDYVFEEGRSYRIDFGILASFGPLSDENNIIILELREGSNTLHRTAIPGDTLGHTLGVDGTHIIKSSPWDASKVLTLRFQKRGDGQVTIKNTEQASYLSVTDIGGRFV